MHTLRNKHTQAQLHRGTKCERQTSAPPPSGNKTFKHQNKVHLSISNPSREGRLQGGAGMQNTNLPLSERIAIQELENMNDKVDDDTFILSEQCCVCVHHVA